MRTGSPPVQRLLNGADDKLARITARVWLMRFVVLLAYAGLSVALSWPLARDFGTLLIGDGGDARHNLWILWHTQQALLGRQPLFDAPLLFYPRGASLLTHGVGPVTGLFALPFWPWGPAAAYNGAALLGLCLTGCCMYALARGLGFERSVALFAGVALQLAPIHLAGLFGHIEKVFLGLPPLVLLALHYTLNPCRRPWWALLTALLLLLTLLHSGYQFVFTALVVGFFISAALLHTRENIRFLLRRMVLLGLCTALIVGPLLFAIVQVSRDPALAVEAYWESSFNQPDLALYLLPPYFSTLFGSMTQELIQPYQPQILVNLETAVSLSWVVITLCALGLVGGAAGGAAVADVGSAMCALVTRPCAQNPGTDALHHP